MRAILALVVLLLASPAVAQSSYAPNWSTDVVGSGAPGLVQQPLFFWNQFGGTTFDDKPTLRIDRDVSASTGQGVSGNTYKALHVNTATNWVSPGYEWALTAELFNRARKSTGAQNVAINGTAWKDWTDNYEETSTTWAGNFNAVDRTLVSNPTTSLIGVELDLGGIVGGDANRQRVISHATASGQDGAHAGYGYMVSTAPGITIDRAFSTANNGSSFGIGLDLAGASFSGAAILLAPEQWLAFDGTAAGGFGRFMGMHAGQLTYMTPYGPMLRFSDDGAAYVGRLIQTIPHVPASSKAPCEAGEQAWDAAAIYVCIAPNRWRRAALSDW